MVIIERYRVSAPLNIWIRCVSGTGRDLADRDTLKWIFICKVRSSLNVLSRICLSRENVGDVMPSMIGQTYGSRLEIAKVNAK